MEPASIRLIGHALYSLAIAFIFAGSGLGAAITLPVQIGLVAVGVVLAGGCTSAALLGWPPPIRTILGVGVYSVVVGVLYVAYHSPLDIWGQAGFLLLFVTQIPLATAAYLRETRHREAQEAVRG
ncbi:hypothetical protein [Streptomonospora salina]|uniref:CHASE2 domain-containing sensor protein n=1 Tax=Streptomonospora salina TaxID=104205 RepID=A0A841EHA3_9ACTN|nr:hypothetical protein [Streptomonospora salina]MBB6000208.1 CHASE2 domain-containing sensor protein [Streptomonospora salina]